MNREILFRGKRVDNGEWVYGVPVKSNSLSGVSLITELYHVDGSEYNAIECDIIPSTIGQFTGLMDKNGNKIFEGDILHRHLGVLWKVVFIESCWKAVPESPLVTSNLYLSASQFNQTEITGNIHDNPTP